MRRAPLPFLLFLLLLLPALPAMAQQGLLCRAAIEAAERERGVPPRLLTAIARVESGRRDPETGGFHPWPWTVNAAGVGSFHPTKEAAIAHVQMLQARGIRSIDVGCMQVNLRHHPDAFANLEEGFDPLANARYAAGFLARLQETRGNWQAATAAYHSATPELGGPYRAKVETAWAEEQRNPAPPTQLAVAAPARHGPSGLPAGAGGIGGGFLLSNDADRMGPATAAPAGGGRGLEAYRNAPIPLVGRVVAAAAPSTSPAIAPPAPGGLGLRRLF